MKPGSEDNAAISMNWLSAEPKPSSNCPTFGYFGLTKSCQFLFDIGQDDLNHRL
ncbi:hypothetical protein NKJ36_08535 [Mesorhizobium sp. M0142]|uniref:hypothetical protein n=1 Tax=unclassified Mesorhizobium TaxID=325217 RepID=UPI0012EB9AC8|nr:hypothetical protein [Mesorhizobium sp. LSHC420B00]